MLGRVGKRGREVEGAGIEPAMLVSGLPNGPALDWCGLRTLCMLCNPCINWVIPPCVDGGWKRLDENIVGGWDETLCSVVPPVRDTFC